MTILSFFYLQVVQLDDNNMQPFQVEVEKEPAFRWCSLVTAVMSMCCCTALGVIATIMAILSYVDHSTKQYRHAKSKRSVAYGLAIAAIVIGTITAVVIITLIMRQIMEDGDDQDD